MHLQTKSILHKQACTYKIMPSSKSQTKKSSAKKRAGKGNTPRGRKALSPPYRSSARRLSPTLTDEERRLKETMVASSINDIKKLFKEKGVPFPSNLNAKLDLASHLVTALAARRLASPDKTGKGTFQTAPPKAQTVEGKDKKRKRKFNVENLSPDEKRDLLERLLEEVDEDSADKGLGLGGPLSRSADSLCSLRDCGGCRIERSRRVR